MATAKKLPSGSWRCLIYTGNDKNGKRQYKSFTAATKREAEYLATQYMVSLEEHKKQKKSDALFSDALSQYIASKTPVLSPSTIRGYRNIETILNREFSFFMYKLYNLCTC